MYLSKSLVSGFSLIAFSLALLFLVLPTFIAAQSIGPIKVEVAFQEGKYLLLRGGEPYVVKGAGVDNLDLQRLAAHGGNSIRTWSIDHHAEPAQQLLDRAHQLGLTVSLGLEIARERHGFDYNDKEAVAEQLAKTKQHVLRYKDHPALLTWFIGNELNFNYQNPKVFDAINDIAKMIKQLDPNHPTTTPLAGFDIRALNEMDSRTPDLDFVSFQVYASVFALPQYIEKNGFDKPYFVTEWGSVGHWEVAKTEWGAPIENTSTEKAENYYNSYFDVLQPQASKAIGNYVFLWGQKQEKTPTWYGMFLNSGEETEAVDVMHFIWNGEWPENRVPSINPIKLNNQSAFDNVKLNKAQTVNASVEVVDLDQDKIEYQWFIKEESTSKNVGGDKEYLPKTISGLIKQQDHQIELTAPSKSGAYRLFVYALDGNNNAAHANIPFYVN